MEHFDLSEFWAKGRDAVDKALDLALPQIESDPLRLREGMRYAVLQGGKRMRPVVTFAVAQSLGATRESALPAACALELVHAYSLVHDDLPAMDDDALRRGQPTVHVAFGEGAAILVGDALLTEAFGLLARQSQGAARRRVADAVDILAKHAGIEGMVGGQGRDLVEGQAIEDISTLEGIHALKTGGLYAAAAALGALAADASPEAVTALEKWGLNFGIAFQHADDALDDEQQPLRELALERVNALVEECDQIAEGLDGADATALKGISAWVLERAQKASSGEKRE